jgi:MFS family permease
VPTAAEQRAVALTLCAVEVLAKAVTMTFKALIPTFIAEWQLSHAEDGWISGAAYAGYMAGVPLLVSLTDRIDARRIVLVFALVACLSSLGYALFATGVWSALAFRVLNGLALAGTYMPGLKALTDRVGGLRQARFIAFYTATFGIGTSLSLILAGWLGAALPWRTAFALLAAGPLLALPLVLTALAPQRPQSAHRAPWLPRFGPVLAQREVRRYITGYAVHSWELFGLRSWLVAFIVFAAAASSQPPPLTATEAAALINLLGLPASILGNEAAGRVGRSRWIVAVMIGSGLLCWLAGFSASWPWWLMLATLTVYFTCVMADSAALTAGLVAATPLAQRGAAMAVYSLFGFGAGFIAPLVFGAALDAAGGGATAWALAFGTLGSGGLVWALTERRRTSAV